MSVIRRPSSGICGHLVHNIAVDTQGLEGPTPELPSGVFNA